jgi:hypothetical protein
MLMSAISSSVPPRKPDTVVIDSGSFTSRQLWFADILRDQGLGVEFSKSFFGCATGVAGRKILPVGR